MNIDLPLRVLFPSLDLRKDASELNGNVAAYLAAYRVSGNVGGSCGRILAAERVLHDLGRESDWSALEIDTP